MTLVAAVDQCSAQTARALTDQLRQSLTVAWELLVEAYQRRAWAALGYESWDAYTDAELGETRLRLPREQRREVVASMTEAGMSTRAIGSALGVADQTVRADQRKVRDFTHEESAPIPVGQTALADDGEVIDAELVDDEPSVPTSVLGTDGKTYTVTAKPTTPRRRPLTDAFWDAAYDLNKNVERIARLADDDRFPQNAEQVAASHRGDLLRAIETLRHVLNHFPGEPA